MVQHSDHIDGLSFFNHLELEPVCGLDAYKRRCDLRHSDLVAFSFYDLDDSPGQPLFRRIIVLVDDNDLI